MQYQLNPDQQAFFDEVQEFVQSHLSPTVAAKIKRSEGASREEIAEWTSILNSRGWAAPSWPVEHGGPGWNLVQRHLFDVVCRQAHAPTLNGADFNMVGPAICKYGSPEMQAEFLPKILSGESS